MRIEITGQGKNRVMEALPGENLGRLLVENGLLSGLECGRGVCGKCAARLLRGSVTPVSPDEDVGRGLAPGQILTCRSLVGEEDLELFLDGHGVAGAAKNCLPPLGSRPDPPAYVEKICVAAPPTEAGRSAIERLARALGREIRPSLAALQKAPRLLQGRSARVTAVLAGAELLTLEEGDSRASNFGFALDLGSTTLAACLVDCHAEKIIDALGAPNPQRAYGADVISRIAAAGEPQNLQKMQAAILASAGGLFSVMLERHKIPAANIYCIMVVGNTPMSHLFLGVEPAGLRASPFAPCFRQSVVVAAGELGLPALPQARVVLLPNLSGFVGSDALAVGMNLKGGAACELAVDIGTNGEILLAIAGTVYACSTAAGPAFEGASISQGMPAAPGAIEKVAVGPDEVRLQVIGNAAPLGICGSGLIDAAAEFLRTGVLTPQGRFARPESLPPFLASRLRRNAKGMWEFVLARGGEGEIAITQNDIRELQMAKAAIAAGISILCGQAGVRPSHVARVFLAGAFGACINRENAAALGMFAGIPAERITSLGNAALTGAARCLLSRSELEAADELAARIQPVELAASADFNNLWLRQLDFPMPQKAPAKFPGATD